MNKSDLYKKNPELETLIEVMNWRPTVLVADDEEAIVDIYSIAFEMCEIYDVLTAHGGKELTEILMSKPVIDLVIIDDNMPYMTGFDFTEEFKQIPVYSDVPVIMCDGNYNKSSLKKFIFESKGNIYVYKPTDIFPMINLVNVCLINHYKLIKCSSDDSESFNNLLKERRQWIQMTIKNLNNRNAFWEGFF